MKQARCTLQLTARSAKQLKKEIKLKSSYYPQVYFVLFDEERESAIYLIMEKDIGDFAVNTSHGLNIAVPKDRAAEFDDLVLDYCYFHRKQRFALKDPLGVKSSASHPGNFSVSITKVKRLQSDLFAEPKGFWSWFSKPVNLEQVDLIDELGSHLKHGDSRAAVVVSLSPLVVAAYSDDLDCVALLKFPRDLVDDHRLKVGTKLITVNRYRESEEAPDLVIGSHSSGMYTNFIPQIADFLTDDTDALKERKLGISQDEWERAYEFGMREWKQGVKPRSGAPLDSSTPAV
ncbi:MAG: hypothetical protein ACRC8S_12965 [Fimbriiglobus sp.]